jgi:hypothetical protein
MVIGPYTKSKIRIMNRTRMKNGEYLERKGRGSSSVRRQHDCNDASYERVRELEEHFE